MIYNKKSLQPVEVGVGVRILEAVVDETVAIENCVVAIDDISGAVAFQNRSLASLQSSLKVKAV